MTPVAMFFIGGHEGRGVVHMAQVPMWFRARRLRSSARLSMHRGGSGWPMRRAPGRAKTSGRMTRHTGNRPSVRRVLVGTGVRNHVAGGARMRVAFEYQRDDDRQIMYHLCMPMRAGLRTSDHSPPKACAESDALITTSSKAEKRRHEVR
jgi:hypothetical protein